MVLLDHTVIILRVEQQIKLRLGSTGSTVECKYNNPLKVVKTSQAIDLIEQSMAFVDGSPAGVA